MLSFWGATPAGGSAAVVPSDQPGRPLLVVVERGLGAGVDGESVRAASAAELGARVVGPTELEAPAVAASAPRTDVLLVAISRDTSS